MMDDTQLPAELAEVERALQARRSVPSTEAKTRVMARVQRELAASRRADFWRYAAGLAAAVLLLANAGMSASRLMPSTSPAIDPEELRVAREQIQKLDLGLSDKEIARQAILLTAGRNLVPYKTPYGAPTKWEQ